MTPSEPGWELYRSFLAVVQEGSLSGAARARDDPTHRRTARGCPGASRRDIELGLHAHRSYLDRHGVPTSWETLRDHSLIGFDKETAFIRSVAHGHSALRRPAFSLRTDSDLAHLAAIRAGYGVGICQVALARRDRNLVRILPRAFALKLDTWLVMHEDLRHSPRCSVTFAALSAGLKRYAGSKAAA